MVCRCEHIRRLAQCKLREAISKRARGLSFGYAQDRPFGYAQDRPFGYAQDRPFGANSALRNDRGMRLSFWRGKLPKGGASCLAVDLINNSVPQNRRCNGEWRMPPSTIPNCSTEAHERPSH
jgi:hypothetical protein